MNVSTKKMNSIHKKRRKYIKDAADTFRTHITFWVNVPADLQHWGPSTLLPSDG